MKEVAELTERVNALTKTTLEELQELKQKLFEMEKKLKGQKAKIQQLYDDYNLNLM